MRNNILDPHMNIYLFIEETPAKALHMYVGVRDHSDIYAVKPLSTGIVNVTDVLCTSIYSCQHTTPLMLGNFHPIIFHTKPEESISESKELKCMKLHELSEDILERLELAVNEHLRTWRG